MRSPEQALARLRQRWRRHAGDWLGQGGEWPLGVALQVPGERQAARGWEEFDRWREHWRTWTGPGDVHWGERRWPLLGRQRVPEQWRLRDAGEVAAALGESRRWQEAERNFAGLVQRWPVLASRLRSRFDLLTDLEEVECRRMLDMLAWLEANPDANLFVRQLPVAGLDSKWLEARAGLIGDWLRLIRGMPDDAGFWQASGLRREPDRLRMRVLDPGLRNRVGGLTDIHAPQEELGLLDWRVDRVFVVENKQTGLAFGDLPGAVVLMARGYAIDGLASLPWVRNAPDVRYWGDIDTHGLAILGRLRGRLPQVRSLLMDEQTLLRHRNLWVQEPDPHRAEWIEHLDEREQALYRDLRVDRWGVRLRLEQERIGWESAWTCIAGGA